MRTIRFRRCKTPIEIEHKGKKLIAEVAQQIGDDTVRCIAMNSTDGLVRGAEAVDTGGPITVSGGRGVSGAGV